MTIDDIKHLGTLSRLALSDEEALSFTQEIDAILAYVSAVSAMAGTVEKVTGPVHTVFRDDVVSVAPGSYTEVLLAAAPHRVGQFVQVKKILDQGE